MSYTTTMTEGSELRHIIRFTLPLLAGNLCQQLYNIVDSAIVGRYLGKEALAAVGSTGSITYLFYTLCIGLATGAGILIAQRFGAKDMDAVKKLISNSAYAMLMLGVVISVVSVIFAEPLLKMLGTPDNILGSAAGYMRISCAGTVAVAAYNWINAVLRSLGDAKTPLIFLGVASVLNVGLDLLLVCVIPMGVEGAALATIISQGVSAAGSIIFAFVKNPCFKLKTEQLLFNGHIFAKCLLTGTPIALQNAMVSVSMVALQSTANSFGEDVMAAYTATMRVEQLVQQPFASLNVAISTFAGQNVGAGKKDRAIKGFHKTVLVGLGFSIIMLALFLLFSYNVVGLFVDDSAVLEIGSAALKLSALFYFPLGLIHITRGMLNGAGDVGYALINGIAEVVGRIGFAAILVNIEGVGHWAVWGTTCLTWVLTAAMSLIRYKSGSWQKKLPTQPVEKEKSEITV